MMTECTPMLWPGSWKDPSMLDLLQGTSINCLVMEKAGDLAPVVTRARQEGLQVNDAAAPPSGVAVIEGEWPGVKLNASGAVDRASAGPTGVPWIDSNGWKIRLGAALHPGTGIWVKATTTRERLLPDAYRMAVADAAAHGGRWLISLDKELAAGLAGRKPEALVGWKKITGAAGFFSSRTEWSDYLPEGIVAIISDFSGRNEFMSHELLNLVARTNQQYRIIVKSGVSETSLRGLRAVICPDEEPPAPELRKLVLAFVEAGGLLITGPKWGSLPDKLAAAEEHPRYEVRILGKGRVAVARPDFEDPFVVANDSVVLVSHRHELLRFWNGGAVGSLFAVHPGRKRALVHLLFYSTAFWDNRPSMRVAGKYRAARVWTMDQGTPRDVEMEVQRDAVELHLPPVSQYAAVELEL